MGQSELKLSGKRPSKLKLSGNGNECKPLRYGLGFGLNFRVVALDPNFRKLDIINCANAYQQGTRRVLLLDYDGVDHKPVFLASVIIKHKTCDCSRVLSLYTWV